MVVRQAIDEGIAATGAHHVLVAAGPNVGAQEAVAGFWAGQHDYLRAIRAVQRVVAVVGLQVVHQNVAKEGLVVAQPPQHQRAVG